jgi:methylmalonyl-CoA mutase, N-terminal domain
MPLWTTPTDDADIDVPLTSDQRRSPPTEALGARTLSGEPIAELYTARDLPENADESIGQPGQFPFTRDVYPSMYRGRLKV